jgi:hypothetical protein
MSFVKSAGKVVSFAKFQDVLDRDQRLFDSNEGLDEEVVTPLLKRATERILTKIRASDWWKNYYSTRSTLYAASDSPVVDPNKILERQNDFTDLCVYEALSEYILPVIADFGNPDNAERKKMEYYAAKTERLFSELIVAGDWYDFDGSGVVTSAEKEHGHIQLKRVR